jgi:hypothetical protein
MSIHRIYGSISQPLWPWVLSSGPSVSGIMALIAKSYEIFKHTNIKNNVTHLDNEILLNNKKI